MLNTNTERLSPATSRLIFWRRAAGQISCCSMAANTAHQLKSPGATTCKPLPAKFHVVCAGYFGLGADREDLQLIQIQPDAHPTSAEIPGNPGNRQSILRRHSAGGVSFSGRACVIHRRCKVQKMVTICGNASGSNHLTTDLDNYTPSMENMKKNRRAALPRFPSGNRRNIRERYESSIIPGAWRHCQRPV